MMNHSSNITDIRALHTPAPVGGLEKLVYSEILPDGKIVDHYELRVSMHPRARTTGTRAAEAFAAVVAEIEGSPFEQMRLDPASFPKLAFTHEIPLGDENYPDALTPILDGTYTTMEWELVKETDALDWVKDRLSNSFTNFWTPQEFTTETQLLRHLTQHRPMKIDGFEEQGIAVATPEQLQNWLDEITDYATKLQLKFTKKRPMVCRELVALGLDVDSPARIQDAPDGRLELVVYEHATGRTLTYVMKNA